ncbi:hypothetical protein Tco_1069684 [Tanacetum coccineum]|uniref:Reverse transcriptase domain-containing protein n=1 Tax=Tanacetum coccineum TaxID=301880 RepID=A0ABQ5HL50_9ASTR
MVDQRTMAELLRAATEGYAEPIVVPLILAEHFELKHIIQHTSFVTTAMTAILKQFQATPPPASVKAIEEICITCGGAHPYYQCLATDGNTFLEYQDNFQGYVSAAAIARALIDVYREEMILRDGDERLILNIRHDTSSYSKKPKKESINIIDIYNISHDDYLDDLFANEKITNHLSGNPTPISDPIVSSSPTLTSLEESDLIWEEFKAYLASDSFPRG